MVRRHPLGDGIEPVGPGLQQHQHLVVVLDLALPHVHAADRHRLGTCDQAGVDQSSGDRVGLVDRATGDLDLDVFAHAPRFAQGGVGGTQALRVPRWTGDPIAHVHAPGTPMTAIAAASDLVAVPRDGRRFSATRAVRLGDVGPQGLVRLDAVARYLQDVANDDALDADLPNAFGWVVRRTLVRVGQLPRLGEQLCATTFCSGTGRSWAERRTSFAGDAGGALEAVSLWVQVDPSSGRPTALGDGFTAIYGAAAGGRRVSARLGLPAPPPADADGVSTAIWWVRQVDLDVLGHVNNAVAWAVLHELLGESLAATPGVGEVEHLAPIGPPDSPLELRWQTEDSGATTAWLMAEGSVRMATRWRPA